MLKGVIFLLSVILPKNIDNANDMRQWLLTQISLGQPVSQAQAFLENKGFDCSAVRDAEFSAQAPQQSTVDWSDIDYIYCDWRQPRAWFLFKPSKRWQLALVHDENDQLIDIGVSCGLIAL